MSKVIVRVVLLTACLMLIATSAVATKVWAEPFDAQGRLRVEGAFIAGVGSKDNKIGTVTTNQGVKDAEISGGGGIGGGITVGYGLTPDLDLDLSVGIQRSTLTEDFSNADGSFTRYPLLATVKYRIPIRVGLVKLGIGGGIYPGGELDSDFSKVTGGSHDVIDYDTAFGAHGSAEYEIVNRDWSFVFGIRYSYVKYDAKSWTRNGVSISAASLTDKFRNLDGSGVDFIIGVGRYF